MASSSSAVPNRSRVVMNARLFGRWRAASTGGVRALSRAAQLVLPLHRVGATQQIGWPVRTAQLILPFLPVRATQQIGWPVWTAQLILSCIQVGATQKIGVGWPVRAA
jgi:hypothetical protein